MRWLSRRTTPAAPSRRHSGVTVRDLAPPYRHIGSGVHLGFADGSAWELPATDPRAKTFRALALALTQGHR
jgi:hypothetical protein